MSSIGTFTPEQARELWQWYQTQRQLKPDLTRNYPQRRPIDEPSPHRVFVKNASGEEIPAYACMRVTGTETVAGKILLKVEKPTSISGAFLFNSQFAIPVPSATESGAGWAYKFGVVLMLGDAPSSPGELYRPIVGSWEIEPGGDQFLIYGRHEATARALVGRFAVEAGIREAIVTSCQGDGWWEVELAEFTGEPNLGYSGQSGPTDGCDLCAVAGLDTTPGSSCETVVTMSVSRTPPVGTNRFVYAHDVEYLPLEIGGHCRIMPIHRSPITGEQLYAVVRGPHPLLKDPKGDWDCCDGTVVQTECSYNIVEGVHCSAWVQDCPS